MLTLLSISRGLSTSRGNAAPPQVQLTTEDPSPVDDETISGTALERAFCKQLRNGELPAFPDTPENQVIRSGETDSDEKTGDSEPASMTLLNVRIEKITNARLFNLLRRFANILGPDYAVALGYLEGPGVVVAFGKKPPSYELLNHFRQYEDIELLHAPLDCLDDFDRITIVNGLNQVMVTATPGRIFTPAGGGCGEFYLKTSEELDFDSILGLRIESEG